MRCERFQSKMIATKNWSMATAPPKVLMMMIRTFFRFIFFLQEKDCIFPAVTDLFIVRITNLLFEMEITLESFQIKHVFFKTSTFKTFLFILDKLIEFYLCNLFEVELVCGKKYLFCCWNIFVLVSNPKKSSKLFVLAAFECGWQNENCLLKNFLVSHFSYFCSTTFYCVCARESVSGWVSVLHQNQVFLFRKLSSNWNRDKTTIRTYTKEKILK